MVWWMKSAELREGKLKSNERHIVGLVLVTTWQMQCVTRESVSNTLLLPRACSNEFFLQRVDYD